MIRKTILGLAAVSLLAGAGATTTLHGAENLPGAIFPFPSVASDQNIREELRELGFTEIQEIDAGGNVYETIAVWQGEFVSLSVDGRNGAITERYHPDVAKLNLAADADEAAMVTALEQRGYTVRGPMEQRGDLVVYPVQRLDRSGVVMINPRTGAYYDTIMVGQPAIPMNDNWNDAYVHSELSRLGYRHISVEGRSGDVYRARATRNGQPVTLGIDMMTGVVYES